MVAGAGPTTAGMTELGCHSRADGNPGSCFIRMDPRRLLAGMTEVNGHARHLGSGLAFSRHSRVYAPKLRRAGVKKGIQG
jgi:hypothetical protein